MTTTYVPKEKMHLRVKLPMRRSPEKGHIIEQSSLQEGPYGKNISSSKAFGEKALLKTKIFAQEGPRDEGLRAEQVNNPCHRSGRRS